MALDRGEARRNLAKQDEKCRRAKDRQEDAWLHEQRKASAILCRCHSVVSLCFPLPRMNAMAAWPLIEHGVDRARRSGSQRLLRV